MDPTQEDYGQTVIKKGDDGSKILGRMCLESAEFNSCTKQVAYGKDELFLSKIPEGFDIVVHSASGDANEVDIDKHALSVVEKLILQAEQLGAEPIGFANVIDSNTGDLDMLRSIADVFMHKARTNSFSILNGENAILGERINPDYQANIAGTFISIVPKERITSADFSFARFSPNGHYVFMGSDGVGTKTELYERKFPRLEPAWWDSLAMKADDMAKIGAVIKVVSDTLDMNGINQEEFLRESKGNLKYLMSELEKFGFQYLLQKESVGNRLRGFDINQFACNLSGSAVGVLRRERINNPLIPKPGDYLVAFHTKPNPRSNGMTDKRKAMVSIGGNYWHEKRELKPFLEYLSSPSYCYYPFVMDDLLPRNLVSAFFHNSGGAFNGKLASPLAKYGLFVELENLFNPPWQELALCGMLLNNAEKSYAKYPMGNEAFIATSDPDTVIERASRNKIYARVVGQLQTAVEGRTGVQLTAFNGEPVYFSGNN